MTGGSYELTATLESEKYSDKSTTDGGIDPATLEIGTDLKLSPFVHGLVGYWKFDETGTTANDSSGFGNNGAMFSSTSTTDLHLASTTCKTGNRCVKFDGTDDYVNMGNPSSLQLTGAMTVSVWVKHNSLNTASRFIAKQGVSGERSWSLNMEDVNPDTYNFFIAVNGGTSVGVGSSAADGPIIGQWTHLVGVYKPSVSLELYKDGLIIGNNITSIPASQFNNTLNVNIGRRPDGILYTNGFLDEVLIYNRALSAAEIKASYDATK